MSEQLAVLGEGSTGEALVYLGKGEARTTSLLVAEKFEKRHKNVIQAIERLECSEQFRRLNFQPSSYENDQEKIQPMYEMTKNGFSILAMGFTGKRAMEWKEKYILAFSMMETEIQRLAIQQANEQWQLEHGSIPTIRELLAEDRISRLAIKPDGTTTATIKKPSPLGASKPETSAQDLQDKVLAIVKRLGSPTAREVKRYINLPKTTLVQILDMMAQEGVIGSSQAGGERGPKTTRYFLRA